MPKASINIDVNDKSAEVLKALRGKVSLAFEAIGAEATTYAMKDTPVDTGTLRNSIAWATTANSGGGDSDPQQTPEENTVYIGTNVDYGVYVEYGDYNHKVGKKHFLRDSVANHGEHFKAILEAALKS